MPHRIHVTLPAAALAAASVLCIADTTSSVSLTRIVPNAGFARAVQSVRAGREHVDAMSFVKIDAAGRVVVAGYALVPGQPGSARDAQPVIARFNPNGRLDRTFSGNGIAPLPLQGYPTGFTIDRQGRLVVSGLFHDHAAIVGHLARLLPDGTIDASFGHDGFARSGSEPDVEPRRVQASPVDDSLLALVQRAGDDYGVVRVTAEGSSDATFGDAGFAKIAIASFRPGDLAVDSEGRAIVAGDGGIVRFDAVGARDMSFGVEGALVGPNGGAVNAQSIEIDGQGRLVALGGEPGGSGRFIRFLPSGAPDVSFSDAVGGTLGVPGDAEAPQFALGIAPGDVDRYVIVSTLHVYAADLGRQIGYGAFAQAIDPTTPNVVSAYVRRDPRRRHALPQTFLADAAVSADGRTAFVAGAVEVDTPSGDVGRLSPVLLRLDLSHATAAPLPDLAIEWTGVPTVAAHGPTFDGTLRMTNTGRAASANSRVELYLSDDDVLDAGDRRLFSDATGPLRAGGTKDLPLKSPNMDAPGARGKRLIAVLQALESDPTGRIAVSAPIE